MPYSPLGKVFLTGAMNENTKLSGNDFRSILPRLLFSDHSALPGELAARHAMPTAHGNRRFTAAVGLLSYGGTSSILTG